MFGRGGVTTVTASIAFVALAGTLPAQNLGQAGVDSILVARQEALRIAATGELWPGFRPDTIPVFIFVSGRGAVVLEWGDALPDGFEPVVGVPNAGVRSFTEQEGASTSIVFDGRRAAQLSIRSLEPAGLMGLMLHEAFHVFQDHRRSDTSYFGKRENAFYVSQYPIFDAENAAGMALEGRMLAEAAATSEDLRPLAHRFTAARSARHRRLGSDLAQYEQMTEMNEGLAQYVQIRALLVAARDGVVPWHDSARSAARVELELLGDLLQHGSQSVRRRFYATGTGLGLLLDGLSDDWKGRLMRERLTIQELLAEVSGYRIGEQALVAAARAEFDWDAVAALARRSTDEVAQRHRRQMDESLEKPGILLVLSSDSLSRPISQCGFDPQNLLQVDDDLLLHTRWLRLCGAGVGGDLNTAVVQDRNTGLLRAVIGEPSEVVVTAGGKTIEGDATGSLDDIRISSPTVTLQIEEARIKRDGRQLVVTPIQ